MTGLHQVLFLQKLMEDEIAASINNDDTSQNFHIIFPIMIEVLLDAFTPTRCFFQPEHLLVQFNVNNSNSMQRSITVKKKQKTKL